MTFLALLMILIVLFDLSALLWGVSSIDGPDSPEWERRRYWYGFH
jgi:hypothetical protein